VFYSIIWKYIQYSQIFDALILIFHKIHTQMNFTVTNVHPKLHLLSINYAYNKNQTDTTDYWLLKMSAIYGYQRVQKYRDTSTSTTPIYSNCTNDLICLRRWCSWLLSELQFGASPYPTTSRAFPTRLCVLALRPETSITVISTIKYRRTVIMPVSLRR
jgi:hypothetical protein